MRQDFARRLFPVLQVGRTAAALGPWAGGGGQGFPLPGNLEVAQRRQAFPEGRQFPSGIRGGKLTQRFQRRLHRPGARVEILFDPGLRLLDFLPERLAVALQKCQAGIHQTQLQILSQEEGVGGRQQYRIGPVEALDADLEALDLDIAIDVMPDGGHRIRIVRAAGLVRGTEWNANDLTIVPGTKLPITMLVEHGTHAMGPDRNADGFFTPGHDINRRIGDAWGVRDVEAVEELAVAQGLVLDERVAMPSNNQCLVFRR